MKAIRTAAAALALALTAGAAQADQTAVNVCGDHFVEITLDGDQHLKSVKVDSVRAVHADLFHPNGDRATAMIPIFMDIEHQIGNGYMMIVAGGEVTLFPMRMKRNKAGQWGSPETTGRAVVCTD